MRMNIVLILLILINGISTMEDGMPIETLPTYSNSIVTIEAYGTINEDPCSGTIITPHHVVTTGLCVAGVRSNEIYVTARGSDPNVMIFVIVREIHRYHNLRRIYDHHSPAKELWLHNIAILQLVRELPLGLNCEPIPLNYERWNREAFMECDIIGYNVISPTIMIPQWSTAIIAPNSCVSPETTRLPHEIFAVSTTLATFTAIDAGTSLIHNGTAIGMIVDRVENLQTAAVLIYAYYQDFIEYIIAGGVAEIGESVVHVVVAIFESGVFRCGGFAVHNRYIVTAAHCVEGKDKADLLVSFSNVEIPRMNPPSEWSPVESIEVHPLIHNRNMGEHSMDHNIAVLKLTSNLPWNPMIRLKNLPHPSHISGDRPCEILRWTDPSSENTKSKILMRSFVTVHDRSHGFHDLEEEEFRADGFHDLPIATDKDIGNPVIFENNIIGMVIAIGQTDMDSINPVICLKIRPYEAFIKEVINRT